MEAVCPASFSLAICVSMMHAPGPNAHNFTSPHIEPRPSISDHRGYQQATTPFNMGTLDSYAADFSRIEGRFGKEVQGKSAVITGSNTGKWSCVPRRSRGCGTAGRTSLTYSGMC